MRQILGIFTTLPHVIMQRMLTATKLFIYNTVLSRRLCSNIHPMSLIHDTVFSFLVLVQSLAKAPLFLANCCVNTKCFTSTCDCNLKEKNRIFTKYFWSTHRYCVINVTLKSYPSWKWSCQVMLSFVHNRAIRGNCLHWKSAWRCPPTSHSAVSPEAVDLTSGHNMPSSKCVQLFLSGQCCHIL